MSNIDYSCLVTALDKTAQELEHHAATVKKVCKQRILGSFPIEAQQNLAQAVAFHALDAVQDDTENQNKSVSALQSHEVAQAKAGWDWIAKMQSTCRAISQDPHADPHEDSVWPALPKEVAQLIAQY